MLTDFSQLAIHTLTHKPWSLTECIDAFGKAGVGGISIWRNVINPTDGGIGLDAAVKLVRGSGLRVPALVRGGFFSGLGVDGSRDGAGSKPAGD